MIHLPPTAYIEPKEISSVDGLKKNYQHEVEELTSEKIAANKEVQRLLIAVRQSGPVLYMNA